MNQQLSTNEIRAKFLKFFQNREHAILESASLVTPDEKGVTNSTLFNTAGVQPLVPYLLGDEHPKGVRLASSQKCIRTIDIDEVGDKTHLTFFEMLGNWSLGDYFKKESIGWSFEFLTSKEEGLGLDPKRLYITVFAGNDVAEKDTEAVGEWKNYLPESRIFYLEDNWWEAGENGPCGPDTEIFYDTTGELGELTHEEFLQANEDQKLIEIWNNVFMQFEKRDGEVIGKLPRHAVDTGAGLERLAVVINGYESIFETDNFIKIISEIESNSDNFNEESARIIADHIKSAVMIISDGVEPSNTDRGYILRRIIRRAIRHSDKIGLPPHFSDNITSLIHERYKDVYDFDPAQINQILGQEEDKFRKTLEKGLRELSKIIEKEKIISGDNAFKLFSTYGFPIELTSEIAREQNIDIDENEFNSKMQEHQAMSRTAAAGKFKGGLEDQGEMTIKYHTATHLLQQALKDVLGDHVEQKGSNNNEERLRFDFTHEEKMTDEEKQKVEDIVNEKIKESLNVNMVELPKDEALKTGALHLFADKYGDVVSVYYIGDSLENAYSKEFCGGPHVKNTSELGKFRIKKEEASSAGVRRIKAILE
jgi:alanyl-tRNA synthetase